MASPRSLYSKIKEALEIAKGSRPASFSECIANVVESGNPIFYSRHYDPKTDEFKEEISIQIVRKVLRYCRMLELIDSNGALTPAGRNCLRGRQYDDSLAKQVLWYIGEAGVKITALNRTVQTQLQSKPVVFPTPLELWRATQPRMSYSLFVIMLMLLHNCDMTDSSQRRLFLAFRSPK